MTRTRSLFGELSLITDYFPHGIEWFNLNMAAVKSRYFPTHVAEISTLSGLR